MPAEGGARRKRAVGELKRQLILDAARRVFESEGLEGASLRAIAQEAGYTPAALYFHFDSREVLYAELLSQSLEALKASVDRAVSKADGPVDRLRQAALAFFRFYERSPRDLDLGFYLFRGGMTPEGVGRDRDAELNQRLAATLQPIADAAAELGVEMDQARRLMADIFAHATGLLLLAHTGRIRIFGVAAAELMRDFVEDRIARLTG